MRFTVIMCMCTLEHRYRKYTNLRHYATVDGNMTARRDSGRSQQMTINIPYIQILLSACCNVSLPSKMTNLQQCW